MNRLSFNDPRQVGQQFQFYPSTRTVKVPTEVKPVVLPNKLSIFFQRWLTYRHLDPNGLPLDKQYSGEPFKSSNYAKRLSKKLGIADDDIPLFYSKETGKWSWIPTLLTSTGSSQSHTTQTFPALKPPDTRSRVAVYVPTVNIQNDAWLFSAYFLWDQLLRIVPDGYPVEESSLELKLRNETPGFLNVLYVDRFKQHALGLYREIGDFLLCTEEGEDLLENYQEMVSINKDKLTPELLNTWNQWDIEFSPALAGFQVQAIWADLWVIVLAHEAGRYNEMAVITDHPRAVRLLELCHTRRPLLSLPNWERQVAVDQIKTTVLGMTIPVLSVEGPAKNILSGAELWQLKRDLSDIRHQYHDALDSKISRIKQAMAGNYNSEDLIRELRDSLDKPMPAVMENQWLNKGLAFNQLHQKVWFILGENLALPDSFPYSLRTLSSSETLANSSKPLLYEYLLKQGLSKGEVSG